jgi:septal ring factor EnvC (AmiA/AmiB activator)
MQTKTLSERIAEIIDEGNACEDSDVAYLLNKMALICSEAVAENEALKAKNKELENELIKSSQDWQSLSKDYVQIEEENEALKAKLKEEETELAVGAGFDAGYFHALEGLKLIILSTGKKEATISIQLIDGMISETKKQLEAMKHER